MNVKDPSVSARLLAGIAGGGGLPGPAPDESILLRRESLLPPSPFCLPLLSGDADRCDGVPGLPKLALKAG